MTSPTLRAALERAARYSRVTADLAVNWTDVDGDDFVYVNSWQDGAQRPAHPAVDAATAAIVRATRAMLGRQLTPTRLELIRPVPRNLDRFESFFRCPLRFAAAENVLAFARSDAERPVPGGHDRLASVGDQAVTGYLATLEPATISGQVRELLVDALEAGEPDVDAVAKELTMSGRTMQRRLQDEGTSFRDVLATTRATSPRRCSPLGWARSRTSATASGSARRRRSPGRSAAGPASHRPPGGGPTSVDLPVTP